MQPPRNQSINHRDGNQALVRNRIPRAGLKQLLLFLILSCLAIRFSSTTIEKSYAVVNAGGDSELPTIFATGKNNNITASLSSTVEDEKEEGEEMGGEEDEVEEKEKQEEEARDEENEEQDAVVNAVGGERKRRRRRPILYLHPGPPKTATTTIQVALFKYTEELKDDGIVFLGKNVPKKDSWKDGFPHPSYCPMYLRYQERAKNLTAENGNCMNRTADLLDGYYANGNDVVMSCEVIGIMFSSKGKNLGRATGGLDDWADLVFRNDWDVRVTIGYRPYFDFVLSQHNQRWKTSNKAKAKLQAWPSRGGKSIPTMRDVSQRKDFDGEWPASAELARLFKRRFRNVTAFDITHQPPGTDLTTMFFCDVLEGADTACRAARKALLNANNNNKRKNVAEPLDYDMLATAASERSLFDLSSLERSEVAAKVRDRHENQLGLKPADFPLVCPSEDRLDFLLNESLAQEMELFPHRRESKTKTSFDEKMRRKVFCNVDVNKVLDENENDGDNENGWKEFFRSLNATTKRTRSNNHHQPPTKKRRRKKKTKYAKGGKIKVM